jgi:3-methyladenine DNA glycosylase AlkD
VVVPRRRTALWVRGEERRLVAKLRLLAEPAGTDALRSYLGSPVPVLGVRVPDLRKLVREESGRLGPRSRADARALVRRLWKGAWFEERLVAIELLDRSPLRFDKSTWDLAARWVDTATGWALSDSLASGPIAKRVAARPERFADLLAWTGSPNLWRRRAATYALRGWVRTGELGRPFALLERLLDDPERWVQRAVGTWLRECWKKDRPATERFLRREVRRLAPVTITVATERAPRRFREELRRANGRRHARPRGL